MGQWSPLLIRSALVLKLLMNEETGAIAAAPTTSLPEMIGGERNWDYRYAWIRDGSHTAQALISLGHTTEALKFLCWLEKISKLYGVDGWGVSIVYGVHGERHLEETELTHLEGYKGSRPVRIGNSAYQQYQLEGYGELLISAYELSRRGVRLSPSLVQFLSSLVDEAVQVWKRPDQGIWEIRDRPRHFVYSKVMVWTALDRAIRLAQWYDLGDRLEGWRKARDEIKEVVLEKGFDDGLNSFVQYFGSSVVDAANLRLPVLGFLPFRDPRIQGTIDRTLEDLMENGLVYRYRNPDGLMGKEGAFAACTFWLVDALALSGRTEEAWDIFDGMTKHANHVGLFSEQYDPATGEALGNFPQAYSHVALINSAINLAYAEGWETPGITPIGVLTVNPSDENRQ
jgi:pentatricopeptide repeat protein